MMLRSVLARVIVSMAGAMPVALTATARAQDLNAYCAKAANDDRVKPIPEALLPRRAGFSTWSRRTTPTLCLGAPFIAA